MFRELYIGKRIHGDSLMKLRSQEIVDEMRWSFFIGAIRLILEDKIIVPALLDSEASTDARSTAWCLTKSCSEIQKRIPSGDFGGACFRRESVLLTFLR